MTTENKAKADIRGPMAETKAEESNIVPMVSIVPQIEKVSIASEVLRKIKRKNDKLTVRTWVNVSGQEVAIEEKECKLGEPDIKIGDKTYAIDYTSIQNQLGQLVYNTAYRVANGALRYVAQSSHDVDAKLRTKMNARDNLTAIWSRWQLPFIACIIAIVCAIIAISITAVISSQLATANGCLDNEACMVKEIAKIRAEAEKARAEENK